MSEDRVSYALEGRRIRSDLSDIPMPKWVNHEPTEPTMHYRLETLKIGRRDNRTVGRRTRNG